MTFPNRSVFALFKVFSGGIPDALTNNINEACYNGQTNPPVHSQYYNSNTHIQIISISQPFRNTGSPNSPALQ